MLEALREATTQNATPVQPLLLTPGLALTEAAEPVPAPHVNRR